MDTVEDINNVLPDELFLDIFEYLKKKDRLTLRCVCQKWNEFFLTSACFKNDRILYLDSFSIDIDFPPASILQNSVGFSTLVISNLSRIDANSEPFWRQLGTSVTELRISHIGMLSEEHSVIFESLLNVKVLHLHNIIESQDFFYSRKKRFSKFLSNIEEIHFGFTPRYLKRVHKIIHLMPNVKKIYSPILKKGHHADEWVNLIDYFLEYQQKLKWVAITVENWKSSHSDKRRIWDDNDTQHLLLQTLKQSKLEGIDYETDDDFELLVKLMEGQAALKSIRIKSTILPPETFTQITHLDLSFKEPVVNFKSLEQLTKLEQLSLHFQWTGIEPLTPFCYFGHDVLKLNTIKKLSINIKTNVQCEKCFKTVLLSMVDLKSLYVTAYEVEIFEFEMVVMYLKGLEQLHLFGINATPEFMMDFIFQMDEDETYDSLTELVLCGMNSMDEHDLNEICLAFPNLKYLTIRANTWNFETFDNVFETLLGRLKHLKKFDPRLTRFDSFDSPTRKTIGIIGELGTNLRVLHLPFNRVSVKEKLQLFAKLPNLHVIVQDQAAEITRTDYYDIFIRFATPMREFVRQIIAKKCEEGFQFM